MTAAALMFACGLLVACFSPCLLARLTGAGISPRLGVTAWLTAITTALACVAVSIQHLITAAVSSWHLLAEAFCRSVTGHACAPPVYRSAIFEVPLATAALAAAVVVPLLAWRCCRFIRRAQRWTAAHAEAARLVGRSLPAVNRAVVLEAPQPAAYCVPGRPAAIVVTTGALAILDSTQFAAVIAHENAHLAGRHHFLVYLTRALAVVVPGVPLFVHAPGAMARLTEMRADDAATTRSSPRVLVTALLAIGTGGIVPPVALPAASYEVAARVQRLLEPPDKGQRARNHLALLTLILVLSVGFILVKQLTGIHS
jgi:Zn-dependent protease with chaperone function